MVDLGAGLVTESESLDLRFPSDLKLEYTPVLQLKPLQVTINKRTEGDQVNRDVSIRNNIITSISLPLTTGLTDSQAFVWETSEGLGGTVGGLVRKTLTDIAKTTGSLASTQFLGRTRRVVTDLAGLTFGLPEFREFGFSFNLIPSSRADINSLNKIITTLKKYSNTNYTSTIINYPSFWKVDLLFPKQNNVEKMIALRQGVITQLSINYAPNNVMTLLNDGSPSNVRIELSIKETTRVSRGSYVVTDNTQKQALDQLIGNRNLTGNALLAQTTSAITNRIQGAVGGAVSRVKSTITSAFNSRVSSIQNTAISGVTNKATSYATNLFKGFSVKSLFRF